MRVNELFVLFSSVSNWMLSATVGCYAIANTLLDTSAELLRSAAVLGLAVQWGAWGDAGMAKDGAYLAGLAALGVHSVRSGSAWTSMRSKRGRISSHRIRSCNSAMRAPMQ